MEQQFRDPGRIPFVRLFARAVAQLVDVANVYLDRTSKHVIDRLPTHASRNLVNKILEWEYGVEIKRICLLMRSEEQRHGSSSDSISSHEGTCPQGAGVSHGQAVLSAAPASGDLRHV
jgi:hypothetical protein